MHMHLFQQSLAGLFQLIANMDMLQTPVHKKARHLRIETPRFLFYPLFALQQNEMLVRLPFKEQNKPISTFALSIRGSIGLWSFGTSNEQNQNNDRQYIRQHCEQL